MFQKKFHVIEIKIEINVVSSKKFYVNNEIDAHDFCKNNLIIHIDIKKKHESKKD